jgi:serine O-acetyltransferase
LISPEIPDLSREEPARFWDPGRKLLRAIRDYQRFEKSGPFISWMRYYALLRYRFWSVITGADIPINSHIGGGLLIPHPNGIVIHPDSRIGVNCLLFQQVTIGSGGVDGVPIIGGHVDIGAGAKILGPVTIGDHAKIGANAVILSDVPAGKTAVGYYSPRASQRND